MNKLTICLGSNQGDRQENILQALEALTVKGVAITERSEIYPALCHAGLGAEFLNTVVRAETTRSLDECERIAKQIEAALGRDRSTPGCVSVDVDIVLFNDKKVRPDDFVRTHFQRGYKQIS